MPLEFMQYFYLQKNKYHFCQNFLQLYNVLGQWCLFTATNPEALDCLSTLKMDFTTATAATSLISCFIMGFFANLPLALAPGMGKEACVGGLERPPLYHLFSVVLCLVSSSNLIHCIL